MRFNVNPLVLLLALAALAVAGVTNFDSITLDSDLIVGDDATVTDDASVGGDLSVTGRATIGTLYPGGGCPSLASAATIAPTESCHTLTGSTAITNITTGNFTTGDRLLLIWGGSITLTHGNDISIGLDFAGASGDVAELVYGGANFSKITTADNTP